MCGCGGDMHGCGGHTWLRGGMCGCRGACMVAGGGVHGCRGCAWLLGGMHGWGASMVAGWGQGACMVAGWGQGAMHGCRGACMVARGVCRIQQDMVNERAVRILLECILVLTIESQSNCERTVMVI